MESIWGDPWADNARPNLPKPKQNDPVEVTTYEPQKPLTSLFSGDLEDEAGWGDFEESTSLPTDAAEESGNQEIGRSTGQGHEYEKGFTNELTPEIPSGLTSTSSILSPGWGDAHALQSTPDPLLDDEQNGDNFENPPSPTRGSPHSSLSSITYAPGDIARHDTDLGPLDANYVQSTLPASPPRPSTSSTTKTAVSTDSNTLSDVPASLVHLDHPRWSSKPPQSRPSDESSRSLDSTQTSSDEADLSSKRVEESALYTGKVEEKANIDAGSLRKLVHAEEEHELAEEEKPCDREDSDELQTEIRGPRFHTDSNLVSRICTAAVFSENFEEPNDEVIKLTSTRKAWYRLTRPQTMREYNTGASADNYVRVSWPRSHIRTETLKIASRWASEDKIYGRMVFGGKPGAATFGWDLPRDGSTAPPRPMSMVHPLSHSKGTANHHEAHQRKSSMPLPSSRIKSSPVAQFGWSTSPTSSGNDAVASLGDVLDSPVLINASEPRPRNEDQQQAARATIPRMAQPSLPGAKALEGAKEVPPSGLQLENRQVIDEPVLGRLSTTELTLNISTGDDDDDWGGMVKSPSEPSSTIVTPYLSASVVEPDCPLTEGHIPINSTRRRPTPIIAPPAAHGSPDSVLSPARKAAFDAARTTRFFNSQPVRNENATNVANDSGSAIHGPQRLSPSPPPWSSPTRVSSSVPRSSSPGGSIRSATGVACFDSPSFLEADVSFFDTPNQSQHSPASARVDNTSVQLSATEEEYAQQIVRHLSDLSFMLR
ncbi:hypothetical protein FKW77_005115 [Venturia effusa]|uniref:Uncharacterized protein n=1 Tax=Venturia effusa TaxID=50376 RepID=A0A517KZG1_9PEZI|nr:hypothetical protein FKW77_005115 [Venturia effusa]